MKSSIKKITLTGILTALALLAFMLESLLPPIIIPGAKLGLSNIFILLALIFVGTPYAFIALVLKALLGSIFSGNMSAIIYSLPAGLISLSIEIILFYFVKELSIICVSITGAVINLAMQNAVFCLITGGAEYLIYLPYLALIGSACGLVVGLAVYYLAKHLPLGSFNMYSEEKF